MLAREDRSTIGLGTAWNLFKVQALLAMAWSSSVEALTQLRERTGGAGRGVLGLALWAAKLGTGMLWFSIGWLGAAEHGLADRQVAIVGGTIGAVTSLFNLAGGIAGRRFAIGGFLLNLIAQAVYGALLAMLGARQARGRG